MVTRNSDQSGDNRKAKFKKVCYSMSLATRNPQVGLRLLCVLQQTFPPVLSQRLGEWGGGPLWFSVKSIFMQENQGICFCSMR